MSLLIESGSETAELDSAALRQTLYSAFEALGARRRVLALPPDITRLALARGRADRAGVGVLSGPADGHAPPRWGRTRR